MYRPFVMIHYLIHSSYWDGFDRLKTNHRFWGLVVLMLCGFVLRIWAIDFGLPHDVRPDEIPNLKVVVENLMAPIVMNNDWRLHPHNFNYGGVYYYLCTVLMGWFFVWEMLSSHVSSVNDFLTMYQYQPDRFHLVLRLHSVLMGTLLIPVTYYLTRTFLHSAKTTLNTMLVETMPWVVTFFVATHWLLVRDSHFGTVDSTLIFFVALSLLLSCRYMNTLLTMSDEQKESPPELFTRAMLLACVGVGFAWGVKAPGILCMVPLSVCLFQRSLRSEHIYWGRFLTDLFQASFVVAFIYVLCNPWVILDSRAFLQSTAYEGWHYFNFSLQNIPTGWVFYPTFAMNLGLGWVVVALSGVGMASLFCEKDRSLRLNHWMLFSFLIVFSLSLGFNMRVMVRYMLPMLPVLLFYTAWGICGITSWMLKALIDSNKIKTTAKVMPLVLLLTLAVLVNATSFGYAIAWNQLIAQPDTREIAASWIIQHAPENTPVATGPRLGQMRLPPNYGRLTVEAGPNVMRPPAKVELSTLDILTKNINTYRDSSVLQKMGIRYVTLFRGHPLFSNAAWDFQHYLSSYKLDYRVTPLRPYSDWKDVGAFEPMDAMMMPFLPSRLIANPGPEVFIFDMQSEAPDDQKDEAQRLFKTNPES